MPQQGCSAGTAGGARYPGCPLPKDGLYAASSWCASNPDLDWHCRLCAVKRSSRGSPCHLCQRAQQAQPCHQLLCLTLTLFSLDTRLSAGCDTTAQNTPAM